MSDPHETHDASRFLSHKAAGEVVAAGLPGLTASDRQLLVSGEAHLRDDRVLFAAPEAFDAHNAMQEDLKQRQVADFLQNTDEGIQMAATASGLRDVAKWVELGANYRAFLKRGELPGSDYENELHERWADSERKARDFVAVTGMNIDADLARNGELEPYNFINMAEKIHEMAESLALNPRYTLEGEVVGGIPARDGETPQLTPGWTYQGVTPVANVAILSPDGRDVVELTLEELDQWNGHTPGKSQAQQ